MSKQLSLLVSGWRFIPHSYALIAQFVCLELQRRDPRPQLFFEDMPYQNPAWQPQAQMFDAAAEATLRALPAAPAGALLDGELRYAFPCDLLRPPRAAKTFVFGTSEFLTVPARNVAQGMNASEAQRRHDFTVLTCSNWSKEGFLRAGLPPERVVVQPLGVDAQIFRPVTDAQRAQVRADSGIAPEDFVFVNISAMTPNKGLGYLLQAFAEVVRQRPQARLILKGMESLYASSSFVNQQLNAMDPALASLAANRLNYVGEGLSFGEMAGVYQGADCYVSPYVAEGFNMPVLEAAACGLPVICTAGGSTDDFVTDDFALRIESKRLPIVDAQDAGATGLRPRHEHLVQLMLKAIDDAAFRRAARAAGPAHVAAGYTWAKVVDRLLPLVFGKGI